MTNITRGCGKRQPGGLYCCTGLSPFGRPFDEFLIDSPIPYEGEKFRAPVLMEKDGKTHVLLWVGAEFYEFVSDFIQEAKAFGISKRIPNNFPIEKLSRGSMMFLVHPKAVIKNYSQLPATEYCPKDNKLHYDNEAYCLGQTYNFVVPNSGDNQRVVGDTSYTVKYQDAQEEPEYLPGIFGAFPITHFDHVMDDGKVNPELAEKQSRIDIPLNFTVD